MSYHQPSRLESYGLQHRVTPDTSPGYLGTLHIQPDPRRGPPTGMPRAIIRIPLDGFSIPVPVQAPSYAVLTQAPRYTIPAHAPRYAVSAQVPINVVYDRQGRPFAIAANGQLYPI
jgi:hypothetical protein